MEYILPIIRTCVYSEYSEDIVSDSHTSLGHMAAPGVGS